jgi:hypothetical protein
MMLWLFIDGGGAQKITISQQKNASWFYGGERVVDGNSTAKAVAIAGLVTNAP